jgi:hypothetical protein
MNAIARAYDIYQSVSEDAYRIAWRIAEACFTRARKLVLVRVVAAILASQRRSLNIEMRWLEEKDVVSVSRQALLKARKKLNPLGIRHLAVKHVGLIYEHAPLKTFLGHLLIAFDGTTINLPTAQVTLERYGNSSAAGARPQATGRMFGASDVLNRVLCDLAVGHMTSSERAYVPDFLSTVSDLTGGRPFIALFDRGFPSIGFLYTLKQAGQPFVMRASSVFLKEEFAQAEAAGGDSVEEIRLTSDRMYHYLKKEPAMYSALMASGPFPVRLIIADVGAKRPVRIITNLGEDFTTADVLEIYRLRWGVETSFRFLKNAVKLESFTGYDPILIEQDIYASMYVLNAAFDIANEAEAEMGVKTDGKGHQLVLNRSFAIGVFKDVFLDIIFSKGDTSALKTRLHEELKRQLQPVRGGRKYDRGSPGSARHARYSNTNKAVF